MENVVFLDIDGVLNRGYPADQDEELSADGIVEAEKVKLLGCLVREMKAKLVLHSGWRFWFSEDMRPIHPHAKILTDALAGEGLVLSDKTPDLTTPEIRRTKKFSKVKAQEILLWVEKHQPDNWLVLDDLPLGSPQIEAHLIRTKTTAGLTEEDVRLALQIKKV